jgi:uncharacterized protein YndB with AHSA1/START domain
MTLTTIEPVRTQVRVNASPERAFEAFTAEFSAWWPLDSHHIGEADAAEGILEPRAGGRWYERGVDGSECDWGRVETFDPPSRLVLVWQLDADWRYDPGLQTEVEVTFTPDGDGTVVALEHRRLDAFGERAGEIRSAVGSEGGWPGLLQRYAAQV